VCFIENRLDVRYACRRWQLLQLTSLSSLKFRLDRLEFIESERLAQYLGLRRQAAAKADIRAVHFLASLDRRAFLD
jgi:hypothetical protein